MIEKLLKTIETKYPLTEQDAGDYAKLKANGMKFSIHAYKAEGLGWISVMTASGFFGLMKMDTLIINPTEADMPLLSYDRVHAMGNDTLIYELYDTLVGQPDLSLLDKAKGRTNLLPDHDLGKHWYDGIKLPQSLSKKCKKVQTPAFDDAAHQYLVAFLNDAKSAPACEAQAKQEKASVYVEGLLSNGGPSTDVFKKSLGEEKTAELFRTVLFGTNA